MKPINALAKGDIYQTDIANIAGPSHGSPGPNGLQGWDIIQSPRRYPTPVPPIKILRKITAAEIIGCCRAKPLILRFTNLP